MNVLHFLNWNLNKKSRDQTHNFHFDTGQRFWFAGFWQTRRCYVGIVVNIIAIIAVYRAHCRVVIDVVDVGRHRRWWIWSEFGGNLVQIVACRATADGLDGKRRLLNNESIIWGIWMHVIGYSLIWFDPKAPPWLVPLNIVWVTLYSLNQTGGNIIYNKFKSC